MEVSWYATVGGECVPWMGSVFINGRNAQVDLLMVSRISYYYVVSPFHGLERTCATVRS